MDHGHFGCFHLLVSVSNAAMNTRIQISLSLPAFKPFVCLPWSGIDGSYVNLCLSFWWTAILFSTVDAQFYSFYIWQSNMELYRSTLFCWSIHPLMDIQIVSTIGPMSTMLLWIFMYKFLFGHLFSILCGIYLGVKLLNQTLIVFYLFEEISNYRTYCLHHFTFPQAMCKSSNF